VEPLDQAVFSEDRLDLGGAMDICAKGRPHQAETGVQERDPYPSEPRVTRVHEAIPATSQDRRSTDQGGHIRVAADDPVKRDQVGRVNVICERDEVAGEVVDAVGMTLPFGFGTRDRDVGARCVHVDRSGGPGPQELVVDRTHPTADFEDGAPVDTPCRKLLDQCPSQALRALLTVGAKTLGRVARVELTIERGVVRRAAVHAPDPSSRCGRVRVLGSTTTGASPTRRSPRPQT